ncbi:hypothetical protein Ssi02_05740 [Sinosporangium siamense]|uniref:Uncharacterized protein n=1 Tax=Sinosporangium siamense TaxID=1367973 RepID=A0A919RAI3_9ACTN|nr:hypothetical protein Ssi02_05740 [Sinosporangium siamense]
MAVEDRKVRHDDVDQVGWTQLNQFSYKNHRRFSRTCVCQERTEVRVCGDDCPAARNSEFHDRRIGCARRPKVAHMDRIMISFVQEFGNAR